MPILIDGYNLLYALGRLSPHSTRTALEGARRWLLQQLNTSPRGADMTVVFDGGMHGPDEEVIGRVHVVYSKKVEADDVIEDLIRNTPTPRTLTVVSNDHRLKQAAQRAGCLALGALDFYEQLFFTPQARADLSPEGSAKPETVTPEEAERWLREFADLDDDPLLRDPY